MEKHLASECVANLTLCAYSDWLLGVSTFEHPITGKRNCVPKELPFGWVEEFEGSSKVYVNVNTGQTTTVDPRLAFKVFEYILEKTFDPYVRYVNPSTVI